MFTVWFRGKVKHSASLAALLNVNPQGVYGYHIAVTSIPLSRNLIGCCELESSLSYSCTSCTRSMNAVLN